MLDSGAASFRVFAGGSNGYLADPFPFRHEGPTGRTGGSSARADPLFGHPALQCIGSAVAACRARQAGHPAPAADGAALVAEARLFPVRPQGVLVPLRTCYRSPLLAAGDLDRLYSEIVLLPI
ncbi:hypothetical protein CP49_21895 [Bradyrhizobium valentinum]|uniref:Uncharacterized protein n=1 Tax=Bradyrhizobium valentinum TaxID=1518501 RepID=A0A0R3LS76_9BRAD|nr:hypothetical protein CP49_21895 [Bradyrhizobium valentinum]